MKARCEHGRAWFRRCVKCEMRALWLDETDRLPNRFDLLYGTGTLYPMHRTDTLVRYLAGDRSNT